MKPSDEDQDLRSLLTAWRPPPPRADPHFQSAVWARIEARPAAFSLRDLLKNPGQALPRLFNRSLATTTLSVAVAVIAGVSLALTYTRAHTNERMASAYIASIDPLQGPHLASSGSTLQGHLHHSPDSR